MSAEQMVAYDFDRLLAQWPGLLKGLAAHIEDVRQYGSVKQAIAEAESRLSVAHAEEITFKSEMQERKNAAEAEHANRQVALDAALRSRKEEIDKLLIDAQVQARKIADAGEDKKARILAEAQVAKAAVDQRVKDAQQQAVELEGRIGDMNQQILDLDTVSQAKSVELAKIQAAIDQLRAKIA